MSVGRNALLGAIVFGLVGALAGYVWTAFEFPFAIVVPGIVGWYAVTSAAFGTRTALLAGLIGGVTFTGVFIAAIYFAITDGSPLSLPAWAGAVLGAATAGALTGMLLDRVRGAVAMASFSAAGMLAAVGLAALLRSIAPAAIDVEGATQYAYFAMTIGVVGATLGAAIGAGSALIGSRRDAEGAAS